MPITATVYILICRDSSYYVGSTRDANIAYRIAQHNQGFGGQYTARRWPVELVWAETFARYDDAFAVERQLKHWSRAKKEALIRGDWDLIHRLAGNKSARRKRDKGSG